MGLQEPGILPDDVHDVRRNHRLVVLAPLHLAQTEQVLDHGNQKPLLLLLRHGAGNGSDGPAEGVEVSSAERVWEVLNFSIFSQMIISFLFFFVSPPLRAVDLERQFFQHDVLSVVTVQVREVD